ncbi:hypothetical protein CsSME_00040122 [Camellia sinensis var. sinensis]
MDIRFRSFLTPHNLWSTSSRIPKRLIKPRCSLRRSALLTKESKHCIQSDRENISRVEIMNSPASPRLS